MKVEEVKEHEDGSGTYTFDMTALETEGLFRSGLQSILGNKVKVLPHDNKAEIVLDSLDDVGNKRVFNIEDDLFNMVVEQGIMNAIKKGLEASNENSL